MKLRYHHLGIPTEVPHDGEEYLLEFDIWVRPCDTNPFGIEWMRFGPNCRLPELVRTHPHLAFEVDDLNEALAGREVIIEPNSPSPGVRVAFVVEDGLPVEFLEVRRTGS